MNDIRVYRAKKELDTSLGKEGARRKTYNFLIEVYIGMIEQRIDIESKLQDKTISEDSRKILEQIHKDLLSDIEEYKSALLV